MSLIQDMENRSKKIENYIPLHRILTIQMIMNVTHLSNGNVWENTHDERRLSMVSTRWIVTFFTLPSFISSCGRSFLAMSTDLPTLS